MSAILSIYTTQAQFVPGFKAAVNAVFNLELFKDGTEPLITFL